MRHACRKLNLYENMIFNTFISKAVWCRSECRWEIFVGDEILATAQFYLPCTGYTGKKYVPDLKGLGSFEHAYHTSEWPRGLSVDGKRVGVSKYTLVSISC